MRSKENVSVLMPTYNAVEYLDAAVLSLITQTHKDFQLLAYDDYSTDGTFERMKFWQNIDNRIIAVRPFNSHTGYVELLNQMIEDANSYYLARQDADDISLPRRFEVQFSFIKDKPNAVLIGTQGVNIVQNENARISWDYPWESQFVNPSASGSVPVNSLMKTRHRIIHGSMFMIRDVLKEVGSYDSDLVPIEDWDLSLKMSQKGDVYVVPEVLYIRRIHDSNVSKLHPNKKRAVEIICQRYGIDIDIPSTRPTHL